MPQGHELFDITGSSLVQEKKDLIHSFNYTFLQKNSTDTSEAVECIHPSVFL